MSKKVCVVSACPDTYSGYGGRSRDLIKELIRVKPEWDVFYLSQRWGNCRMGYLEDHNEKELMSHEIDKVTTQPDIWIQITVPNEFRAVGKYNIGITAAMETNICDSSWVQGCNMMDLVLVSSKHSKFSLTNSKYLSNKDGSTLEVKTPIEVLFEGLDIDIYHETDQRSSILADIDSPWNYLVVGHWLPGIIGEDRKNIGYTIKAFLETFKDTDYAPGLILKITEGVTSIMDRDKILDKIYSIKSNINYNKSLPKIYLLHGDLTEEEMNLLYNDPKVKAMVSFTKGEGFGRPLLEFASTGKPILCSGWSGQLDFLNTEYTAFVGGTVEKVHSSAAVEHVILEDASWFRPNDKQVTIGLTEVFKSYDFWLKKAKKQAKEINNEFTRTQMGNKLLDILNKNIIY